VIARSAKTSAQRGFFIVPLAEDQSRWPERDVPRRRMRVRTWEARRRRAGQALIVLSFPMAYQLVMASMGAPPSSVAMRVLVWMWVAALAVAIVCAEAVWRNRVRLEHMTNEPLRAAPHAADP